MSAPVPALIAVAHGSRDPRSAATISAAIDRVRQYRPEVDVRLAFLDLNAPSVDSAIDAVAVQGHSSVIAVPLLLGDAYHARVDLPSLLDSARARHPQLWIHQAPVLGADQLLVDAAREHIVRTGVRADDPTVGIAVAAVGSSRPEANARVAEVARSIVQGTCWHAAECFATIGGAEPAITRLRARGVQRFVLAPWFLAPGLLLDRLVVESPRVPAAEVLGTHPYLADLVVRRFENARSVAPTPGRLRIA